MSSWHFGGYRNRVSNQVNVENRGFLITPRKAARHGARVAPLLEQMLGSTEAGPGSPQKGGRTVPASKLTPYNAVTSAPAQGVAARAGGQATRALDF